MRLKFSKRQWMLLAIYSNGFFLCGCCASVQAPFYPREAESKGISPSQYGFVFGIYFLTAFIVSPFCGKMISQIGAKLTSNMGLVIAGVTSILFGILDKVYNPELFFTFSLIIRIMEAFGTASFKIAGLGIIATEFSDNLATAFAFLESCFGTGILVGPPVGGLLYEWKGYLAPFLLIGVLLLVAAIGAAILLSQVDEVVNCQRSRKGLLLLLKQPEVLLGTAASFGAYLNISFYQATLEPHIRPFHLNHIKLGFIIVVNSMTYTVLSPVWGIICDKWIPPQYVWSIGAILISAALLLLGPAPYFSFQLNIPLYIFALIIHGIGQSAELVSSFHCFSKIAIKIGFPDDVNTYAIVSALYNASTSLGGFVGPSLGGFLLDYIGFSWAVHVLICYHIALTILTLSYNFLYKETIFPKYKDTSLTESELKAILDN